MQKVAPERGLEVHFGWFLASKIMKKSKKWHRERNQKNDFVSGAHEEPLVLFVKLVEFDETY